MIYPEQRREEERNQQLLAEREEAYNAIEGPRVGDVVLLPDGGEGRFSHDWGDSIQWSRGGSFYLGEGFVSFSGSLNPSIPKERLVETNWTERRSFWFFSGNWQRADNAWNFLMRVRVYRLGEEQ